MTAGRIYRPLPAPLCEKCGLPFAFVQLDSGKWRPCNPDGSDHYDICRDIRYAKAKTGECVEEVTDYPDRIERVVYWNGGAKPFMVLHSSWSKKQIKPSPNGGLKPLAEIQAHAKKHGYTVREFDTPV